jgi:hypothetical protein
VLYAKPPTASAKLPRPIAATLSNLSPREECSGSLDISRFRACCGTVFSLLEKLIKRHDTAYVNNAFDMHRKICLAWAKYAMLQVHDYRN